MFEYHGWVTLRETAGLDDDAELLHRLVEQVRLLLRELGEYHLLDLRWMNGVPFLHLAGFPNHRATWGKKVLDLLENVGRLAPGS
jgi:hypothetical protein